MLFFFIPNSCYYCFDSLKKKKERASITGRLVPKELINESFDQVPKSMKVLAPMVDYFVEVFNPDNSNDTQIITPPNESWETFQNKMGGGQLLSHVA